MCSLLDRGTLTGWLILVKAVRGDTEECNGLVVGLCISTLGGGIGTGAMIFPTLGSLVAMGCFAARFNICATWMYVFVVGEPYCNDGILFFGSCKINRMSVAACRR